MKDILDKNIFEVQTDEEGCFHLVCMGCEKHNKNYRSGFNLDDGPDYSVYQDGYKKKMERWFSNMKHNLILHIQGTPHHKAAKTLLQESALINKTKDEISNRMRHWSYFVLKSNLPFKQFPVLLGTASCNGEELGDINHSEAFMPAFLELVDSELQDKTAEWLIDQTDVTATLDIGTVYGISMLAVLLMSGGKVKLVGIPPVSSKKGVDVATAFFEAFKMDGRVG